MSEEWEPTEPYPHGPLSRIERLCGALTRHRLNRPAMNGYDYFTGRQCRICGHFWHAPW